MIHAILQIYIYIIILDVILSWVPQVREQQWARYVRTAADVTLKPIRDLFPRDIPMDPSPMIVIILIQILMYIL